jgi:hypothetical protein
MVVANNSSIRAPVVFSSTNLSRKSFWNLVQLVMDPTGKLKYHVEAEFSNMYESSYYVFVLNIHKPDHKYEFIDVIFGQT